jgi:DNA ligase (NAD+)
MDIEGLGENIASQLIESGLVKELPDLYSLSHDDFMTLDLFAEKKAKNLYNSIMNTKNCSLANFIYALGIPNIGKHLAGVLASRFRDINLIIQSKYDDLTEIDEIGPIVTDSLIGFFNNSRNLLMIKRLLKAGVYPAYEQTLNSLDGKKFIFTGTLKKYTRKEAESRVMELGGRCVSSVSGNTDFLVAGENPGSKLEKARKLGINIISEDEFAKIIEEKANV